MASIGDGVPGRGPRDALVKFRLKYCPFSIKYCSGRTFICFHEFPAYLHFGFASPAGRETEMQRFLRSLRQRRERKKGFS